MHNARLEYLFTLHLQRTISPAEREELMSLILDPAGDADLQELIDLVIEDPGPGIQMPAEASRAILETILRTPLRVADPAISRSPPSAKIPVIPMPPARTFRRWKYAAAAIVLCLLAGAAWLALSHRILRPAGPPMAVAQDLPPGGNKAILTLAGGRQIILDRARNGELAIQGNTVVQKEASGRLTYKGSADTHDQPVTYNTLSTPRGGEYRLTLPDGTQVWLNAASSITYPTAFTGTARKVSITGEVYFEIARNPHQPFKVSIANVPGATGGSGESVPARGEEEGMGSRGEVEVLGTHFNINAYADEKACVVTLAEGSVRVLKGTATGMLQPGQQALLTDNSLPIQRMEADVEQALAWKNGLFSFKDADIYTVMRQLSRWYNVDVRYSENMRPVLFSGEIGRNLSLANVLNGLEQVNVHFKIEENRRILIMP